MYTVQRTHINVLLDIVFPVPEQNKLLIDLTELKLSKYYNSLSYSGYLFIYSYSGEIQLTYFVVSVIESKILCLY